MSMTVRYAEKKDIPGLLELLSQVLEIHAAIRPDIFVPGTTKYSESDLEKMLLDDRRRIFVALNGEKVAGYAFCEIKEQPFASTMVPFRSLFIDDLCVDRDERGKKIGKALFERAKSEAEELGCYELTLNVWEGNDPAKRFYEKMGMRPKETQMEFILK